MTYKYENEYHDGYNIEQQLPIYTFSSRLRDNFHKTFPIIASQTLMTDAG